MLIYSEKGGFGKSCQKQDAHWKKPGVGTIVASHWLSNGGLSLTGFVATQGEKSLFFLLESAKYSEC